MDYEIGIWSIIIYINKSFLKIFYDVKLLLLFIIKLYFYENLSGISSVILILDTDLNVVYSNENVEECFQFCEGMKLQ